MAAAGNAAAIDAQALAKVYDEKFGFDSRSGTSTSTTGATSRTATWASRWSNFPQPVIAKIALGAVPWTLGLLGVSTFIAFFIGTVRRRAGRLAASAALRAHHRAAVHAAVVGPVLPAGDPARVILRGRVHGCSRPPAGSARPRSSA